MILEVQHETRLEYSEPVTESVTELRMEPVSDADQSCRSFHLAVSPSAEFFRYQDGFGNSVHHFNLLTPLLEALRPRSGTAAGDLALRVARYIPEHFQYARDVTLASSPIDDVLE